MDLVDRDGRGKAVFLLARGHPGGILPVVLEIPDDGGGVGRGFPIKGEGIALVGAVVGHARSDVVFVMRPLAKAGNEAFVDARGIVAHGHGMVFGFPAVKVADHGDGLGIGGPDREMGAGRAVHGHERRTELVGQIEMVPLLKQVDIVVGKSGDIVTRWHGVPHEILLGLTKAWVGWREYRQKGRLGQRGANQAKERRRPEPTS